jgi:hypothetical protein
MDMITLTFKSITLKLRPEELSTKLICFNLRRKGGHGIQPDNIYLQSASDPEEIDIPNVKGVFADAAKFGGSWNIRVSGEQEGGNIYKF